MRLFMLLTHPFPLVRFIVTALLVALSFQGSASAQEERNFRLRFQPGQSSALVKNSVRGYETVS